MRTRAILIGVGFLLLTVLWFLFDARPIQNRIKDLRTQQEAARTQYAQLQQRLERLKQLQRDEPTIRASLARLEDALPTDPRLPDFILQVQESANLAGVPFLSITPSVPAAFAPPPAGAAAATGAAAGPLQSITVTVSTTGKFFELEDFIVRMERLPRAVRVNSFGLSPGGAATAEVPGTSPTMSVSFNMQMFVAAVAAGTPPTPVATAAATPVPGVTASPTPVPTAAG